MTLKEFLSGVWAKAPLALSEASLKFSADEYHREGKITGKHVIECIRDAIRYERYFRFRCEWESKATESPPNADDAPKSPQTLTTDDLIDRLQPVVEELRKRLFGSSDVPFPSKK